MTLLVQVLVASLVGSLHCAGMCGAFVAIAVGSVDGPSAAPRPKAWMLQLAYHGGRLISYTALGAAAGAMGGLLDLAGAMVGIQPIAAILAGAMLIAFGLFALLRLLGVRFSRLPMPAVFRRMLASAHRAAMQRPPIARAAMIGLLTTLLPCGWLYFFVFAAAGTASPLRGALVMAAFWVGTVPILAGIGMGARKLLGAMGRIVPVMTCILLILLGLFTLANRSRLDPKAIAQRIINQRTVATQSSTVPPCCAEHAR